MHPIFYIKLTILSIANVSDNREFRLLRSGDKITEIAIGLIVRFS